MAKTIKCDSTGIRAIKDAMETLSGNWKLPILFSLSGGAKRFKEITREVEGISDKMLSKELKELETNKLITRTVIDTQPITVQYQLTEHGKSLQTIINNLTEWGVKHRLEIIGK